MGAGTVAGAELARSFWSYRVDQQIVVDDNRVHSILDADGKAFRVKSERKGLQRFAPSKAD